MKIVITVEVFDPAKGYLEYYLARELTRLGHKVYIFTFGGTRISRRGLDEGFEVIRISPILSLNGYSVPSLRGLLYIIKFLKKEKPDIIHCNPLFSLLSLVFISLKEYFNYKVVGSLLTQELLNYNLRSILLYCLAKIITAKFANRRSEIIYAKTQTLMRMLVKSFDVELEKIKIIPLGADPDLFTFDLKAKKQIRELLKIGNDDVVIVYSGKIVPSKDVDLLIKALAPIVASDRKVKILIKGKGELSYVKKLKELISDLKLSENVIFQQWVDRRELPAYYSASDIAVWPGRSSISIVEAASVGLPVILRRPSVEIFAIEYGNGFSFEGGNFITLRKYLKMLIYDKKLRAEMGNKSRLLVEHKLNWKTIANQYLDSYTTALESIKK